MKRRQCANHLLGGRTKSELRSIKFDVEVIVSGSYFLGELVALCARVFGIVLVDKLDAKHAAVSKKRKMLGQRGGAIMLVVKG